MTSTGTTLSWTLWKETIRFARPTSWHRNKWQSFDRSYTTSPLFSGLTVDAPQLGKDHARALQGQMIRDELEPLLQSAVATAIKASAVTQLWCAAIRALAGYSPVSPRVTSLEQLKNYIDQLVDELGPGPALEYAMEQLMPTSEDALQGCESALAAMRSSSPEHLMATSLALEPRLAICLRVVFACLRLPVAY